MTTIETLRSYKVGRFAIFDFFVSFLVMFLIGLYFGRPKQFLAATLPLGIFTHLITGTQTPLTKMTIGPGFYYVKIMMIVLTLLAVYP